VVSATEDDLKTTVDAIIADARALQDVEEQKRDLAPRDPRMTDLSRRAEALGRRIEAETTVERKLATEVAEDG
jgi:hypothetical protein